MTPTPYLEINALLQKLQMGVRDILQEQFVGIYLYGSLASGDFNLQTSDIDFVVVTVNLLPENKVSALATLHQQLIESGSKWAAKLEGSYIPEADLHFYTPTAPPYPTLNEGRFYVAPHGFDWVIQRHILREHGVVVAGPPIQPMIDPVQPDQLRQAVAELVQNWWAAMLNDPSPLSRSEYQAYAVLSMCRALHAMRYGVIVSKPDAAKWAQIELGNRWAGLIDQALNWHSGTELDALPEVLDLIRYTVEWGNVWQQQWAGRG